MIEVRVFAGQQPAIAPRLLESPHATHAVNCQLNNGDLRALPGIAQENFQPPLANNAQTLYRYQDNWFSFDKVVSVVSSPIRQDDYNRAYFTGLDVPRVTRNDIAIDVNTPLPALSYKLGIPTPTAKPALTYDPPDINEDELDDNTRFYVITFVSGTGEESAPSPVSNKLVVRDPLNDVVTVALPLLNNNDYDITHIHIYRAQSGGEDAEFFQIGRVNYGTTTFSDDPATFIQGPALATRGYAPPPDDMHSLIRIKGGMLIGASGQTVCPSQAYEPYAYKEANQLVANAEIVAMAPLPSGAIVATTGYPELLSGYAPEDLALDRFELEQACVSARSMVDMGTQVLYASPDGLVSASVNGARLITADMLTSRQWQAYNPASIHAYVYEQQYIGFYTDTNGVSGGFIFDPARKDLVHLDFYADCGYRDLASDNLYLMVNNKLCRYEKGAPLTYLWRSKPFETPDSSYSMYRVKVAPTTTDAPIRVRIFADEVEIVDDTLSSTGQDWGYLPACLASRWSVQIESTVDVEGLLIGDDLAQLGV